MAIPSNWFQFENDRIAAELEVARKLRALNPARAKEWDPLIAKAEAAVKGPAAGANLYELRKAVREAEEILAPLGGPAKELTVHLVGHAHIDMNWLWGWPETVATTIDTFTTVTKLMEDYPAFKFSQSQASVYRIVEEFDPRLLGRITELVRTGRWEVTASHWVECDKNMSGGESLCRHLLYARKYLQGLFGISPDDLVVDWSPDTFGHAATVPTYLARGGVKYLYLHRPGFLGPARPNAFWWKGPDGSKVLTYNDMKLGYNGVITPRLGILSLEFLEVSGSRDMIFVYGVGDHGGGPTRRDIERGIDLGSWPIFPTIHFSTARAFFDKLAAQAGKLATLDCELNTEFAGCYTSQSLIKKANRFAENRLGDAEAAAAFAWGAGCLDYPRDSFTGAWRDTLFSHFHDILPGSGIHDTRTRAHGMYQQTIATTTMAETLALRALSAKADTGSAEKKEAPPEPPVPGTMDGALGFGAGWYVRDGKLSVAELSNDGPVKPFVIWNPTDRDREDIVEAMVWLDPNPGDVSWTVRGPDGHKVPAQKIRSGNEWWRYEYVVLAFPVKVPAFGYAVYTVTIGDQAKEAGEAARLIAPQHPTAYCTVERPVIGLENSLVRVVLDPETACIAEINDKRTGLNLLEGTPAGPLFAVERPHGMTAWTVGHTGPWERLKARSLSGKEGGPYRASVEAELEHGESRFTVTYRLLQNDPTLYVDMEGTWLERGTPEKGVPVLKFSIPLSLSKTSASYEIPFGAIDRPYAGNEEVPALQWACVSGKTAKGSDASLVLANDCKHGHALDDNTLNISLIRSSYDPDPLPEIGRHEMKLSLTPCAGKPPVTEATRLARRLNHPLRPIGTGVHGGSLGKQGSMVSVAGEGVAISGIKKAEEGDAIIVRLYETAGRDTEATIKLNEAALGVPREAHEADMMERKAPGAAVRVEGGAVRVMVPARGIIAVKIITGRGKA